MNEVQDYHLRPKGLNAAGEATTMNDGNYPVSEQLFERAVKCLPGGNTRHTIFFPPYPIYADKGFECRISDLDGNEYIDFINNYSSMIHGHRFPPIVSAVINQVIETSAVGLPTRHEINLAELLCKRVPSIEQIRFTNSGNEAVIMAIKAARTYTGRTKIAKLEGCYHGASDAVEVSLNPSEYDWGPESQPRSVALCEGTPASTLNEVLVLPFNDLSAAEKLLGEHGDELAAVVFDVLPSRLSYLQMTEDFANMLFRLSEAKGFLTLMDEVYSLRFAFGGTQEIYGLQPDLTVLGKIIGGGFPVGAVGGRKSVMDVFNGLHHAPRVLHGGTYNANPVSMRAGLVCLEHFDRSAIDRINRLGSMARTQIRDLIQKSGLEWQVIGNYSVFALAPMTRNIHNVRTMVLSEAEEIRLAAMHRNLLSYGILTSSHGTFVLSTVMDESHIERLVSALAKTLT